MPHEESSTSKPGSCIKDARGRPVTKLDPVMMHLLRQPGVIPPETLREIAEKVGIGLTKTARVLFWASLVGVASCVFVVMVTLVDLSTGRMGLGEFVKRTVSFSGISIGPFAFWIGTRQVRFKRITSVMLKHLRCPHCGYDIRGLPTAPEDGATVCPECGCAWRLDAPRAVGGHGNG